MKTPWRQVEPLPVLNGSVEPVLATVDSLRTAWEGAVSRMSPDEFNEARQRNLRSHAIETGIIERLYDLDWGITEALVAEGITIEVAEREGGVSAELTRPAVIKPASASAIDIARAHADRVRALRNNGSTLNAQHAEILAASVEHRLVHHLQAFGNDLVVTFSPLDARTHVDVRRSSPSSRLTTATDHHETVTLILQTLGRSAAYQVGVRSLEADAGVLVIAAKAWLIPGSSSDRYHALFHPGPTDTVTLVATDTMEARWPEIEELIDRTLAAAIDAFGRLLS